MTYQQPPVKWLAILIFSLFAICIMALCSCSKYTEQAATAQLEKAHDKFPGTVAEKTRQWFPCITTGTKTDSTKYLEWMAAADSLNAIYEREKSKLPEVANLNISDSVDCIEKCNEKINEMNQSIGLKDDYIVKLLRQISTIKNNPIHDTTEVEDKAKTKLMQDEIDRLNKLGASKDATIEKKDAKITEQENKIKHKNKMFLWLLIAFIVSTGLHFVKLKIPFLK